MPKTLWNQGRVVGYSQYELYVKQHMSSNPDIPPASERQWLASTIAMGSSMLLRVDVDTNHKENELWVYEKQFPDTTLLCGANTIVGSFFIGDGVYSDGWATKVTDYGDLISNTVDSSPNGVVGPDGTIPLKSLDSWSDDEKSQLSHYMKVVDGVIIQPGDWVSTGNNAPPQKDLKPNVAQYPRIRLLIKGPIESQFQILLTGFTIRTVVQGLTGLDGSVGSPKPQDGDFLGPGQFPWASKIVFSVPSSYISYFEHGQYVRQLPSGSESNVVNDTSVIDMKTTKPETYYETNYQNARVDINVDDFTTLGDGTSVLTVYQKKDIYPPALYGTFVDSKGQNYLNPIDIVAPGSVKMFEDATEEELKEYEDTFEGTFGVNKNTEDGTIEILDPDGNLVPAAKLKLTELQYANIVSEDTPAKGVLSQTGKSKGLTISLSNDLNSGNQVTIGNDYTAKDNDIGNTVFNVGSLEKLTPKGSNITIAAILEALANNKSIDILGNDLKAVKVGLPQNYIQFPNGLRLYISSEQPSAEGVPVGSIGIGWGYTNG